MSPPFLWADKFRDYKCPNQNLKLITPNKVNIAPTEKYKSVVVTYNDASIFPQ